MTSASAPRVLLVEDEAPIRRFVRAALTQHDYTVAEATCGKEALGHLAVSPPDVVVLDLGLPDMDGLDVIRRVRKWSRVPIVILSARGQESDKVAALDLGADDYLTKPFGVGELLARLRVALRHANGHQGGPEDGLFEVGNLKVDLARRHVFVGGQEVRLTPIEYKLLTTLVRYAGKVVTHRQLLVEVWGPHAALETHYLRVYAGHVRHKIEADPARPKLLLTEPGVGYRLVDE